MCDGASIHQAPRAASSAAMFNGASGDARVPVQS